MAKHRVGSQINAKRTRSVTTSGAATRKLVEDRTGKPYRRPRTSFNNTTGLFEDPDPKPDMASKMQAELRERNHHTRPASKVAELGRVRNLSRRDYSLERGPIVISDNHKWHWERGFYEAANRSQSAPGWVRWETIAIKPKPEAVTLTVIETTVEQVAEELGKAMRPAAEIPDCLKTKWAKDKADHSRPCLEQLTDDPANLTSSHLMHVIENVSKTAAFQDAMCRGDRFDLGFGIYIKAQGYTCDIHCPLPPGRGERWGHMSRGIEVCIVNGGRYQPISAMLFQGNIQRFVLDVLPRIETPEMEVKRKGAAA